METVKCKGMEIELCGKKFILPPLPVVAFSKGDASLKIKAIKMDMDKMATDGLGAITPESWSALISLVTIALRRNYPDVTEAEVEDGLEDVMMLIELMQHLISQNAEYKERAEQERKNALERLAAAAKK